MVLETAPDVCVTSPTLLCVLESSMNRWAGLPLRVSHQPPSLFNFLWFLTLISSFIHSFPSYDLNVCYRPAPVLGTKDTVVNKTDRSQGYRGRQAEKK